MRWLRRWERDDPAAVLERKQDQQVRHRARVNWKEIRIDPFGVMWFGKEQVMTREESEQIEALVMVWFRWTRAYRPNLGAGRVSIYARGMRESVETDADEIDQRLAAAQAEQVDVCIDSLRWQLRAAIGIHAGNKAAGACVFSNLRRVFDDPAGPRYNIPPGTRPLTMHRLAGEFEVDRQWWTWRPSGSKYAMNCARLDKILGNKWPWKMLTGRGRILVPADGWYPR
ncbi:hypothetical protein ACOTB6_24940 [Achromobacter xylosoxidans]